VRLNLALAMKQRHLSHDQAAQQAANHPRCGTPPEGSDQLVIDALQRTGRIPGDDGTNRAHPCIYVAFPMRAIDRSHQPIISSIYIPLAMPVKGHPFWRLSRRSQGQHSYQNVNRR